MVFSFMHKAVVILALALPWLNPFAPGPSPAVAPWLFTVFICATLLISSLICRPSGVIKLRGGYIDAGTVLLASAWMLAGVVSSVIGLLQYFGATAPFEPWVNQAKLGEAFANLRQRNQFASITNIALVSLIWFGVHVFAHPGTDTEVDKRHQPLLLLMAGLVAVGNAASSSRTGLVQFLLVGTLYGIWGSWRSLSIRGILFAGAGAYGIATVALPWLAGLDPSLHGMAARLRAGDELCASRITLWSNVLHLIAQKPWLGWGWGELDYAHYITLYDGPRFCEILDNAHNLPLQLAVELGIPAALLVCGVFLWWVLRQRPWCEKDPIRQLAWSVIAVILLHSMLEYPLWYGPFQMAFGLCIALLWRGREIGEGVKVKPDRTLKGLAVPISQALTASILIVSVAYAAWDYRRISQIYLAPEQRDAAYRIDTLAKIQDSWLFADQVHFAQLLLTPLARDNAEWSFSTATALLHYSPEPRVIERAIESAVMLGRDDEALAHLARYKAAFPKEYARWAQENSTLTKALLPLG